METQYFTFGCGQIFANKYVKIVAETKGNCRDLMFEAFGEKWSMQYDNNDGFVQHGMDLLCTIEYCDDTLVTRTITNHTISIR